MKKSVRWRVYIIIISAITYYNRMWALNHRVASFNYNVRTPCLLVIDDSVYRNRLVTCTTGKTFFDRYENIVGRARSNKTPRSGVSFTIIITRAYTVYTYYETSKIIGLARGISPRYVMYVYVYTRRSYRVLKIYTGFGALIY